MFFGSSSTRDKDNETWLLAGGLVAGLKWMLGWA